MGRIPIKCQRVEQFEYILNNFIYKLNGLPVFIYNENLQLGFMDCYVYYD